MTVEPANTDTISGRPPSGSSADETQRSLRTSGLITARSLFVQHRGGGAYTVIVSQRVGAGLGAVAGRLGCHPSILTLTSLFLGVTSSAAAAAAGIGGIWPLGLVATLGWQTAYAFDCADGQLARLTGRATANGARLDVLVDFVVQTSVAAALTAIAAERSGAPGVLLGAFAALWMVNLFSSVLGARGEIPSLLPSTNRLTKAIKSMRDYGLISLAVGIVISVRPSITAWLLAFFTLLNGTFVLALIGHEARRSISSHEAG